jgi:hypothetical protein
MHVVRHAARAGIAGLALAAAGCGSGGGGGTAATKGPLDWKDAPFLEKVGPSLPDDRILVGTVRNVSVREELKLDSKQITVRDSAGKPLKAFGIFTATFAHGLYGVSEAPNGPVASDRKRLGFTVTLKPGQTAPLTVAYRLAAGVKPPLRVEYPGGRLAVPATLTKARQ